MEARLTTATHLLGATHATMVPYSMKVVMPFFLAGTAKRAPDLVYERFVLGHNVTYPVMSNW